MDPKTLTTALKQEAQRIGFARAGACPAITPQGIHRLADWLRSGYAGQMQFLEARQEAYIHPRHVMDGARALLMLAAPYRTVEPAAPRPGAGRVARYAWGEDYHDVLHQRLRLLADFAMSLAPEARVRGVVDTAPLLEREFAQLAGLGWIGKNTLLLNRELGSWFFFCALLTDQELDYDNPTAADHCGTCRACLDACPTGAFVAPYVLDARRCVSYLTIELRDSVPHELRAGMGDWLFGCDICQDVCPWNHKAPPADEVCWEPALGANPAALAALFELDDAEFRRRFRHTPWWRPRRRGLLRNAAIVLGNQRHEPCLSALTSGLCDVEPVVRGACAWALGRLESPAAGEALCARLPNEPDAEVQREIRLALAGRASANSRQ